jgi:hypothetical protein
LIVIGATEVVDVMVLFVESTFGLPGLLATVHPSSALLIVIGETTVFGLMVLFAESTFGLPGLLTTVHPSSARLIVIGAVVLFTAWFEHFHILPHLMSFVGVTILFL